MRPTTVEYGAFCTRNDIAGRRVRNAQDVVNLGLSRGSFIRESFLNFGDFASSESNDEGIRNILF